MSSAASQFGRDATRHIERMANSGPTLNPGYTKGIEQYFKGVCGKKR